MNCFIDSFASFGATTSSGKNISSILPLKPPKYPTLNYERKLDTLVDGGGLVSTFLAKNIWGASFQNSSPPDFLLIILSFQ